MTIADRIGAWWLGFRWGFEPLNLTWSGDRSRLNDFYAGGRALRQWIGV